VKTGIYPVCGVQLLKASNLAIGRLSSRDIWLGLADGVSTLSLVHIVQCDVDWRLRGATLLATPAQNSRFDGVLPDYTP
jgi:hypothetical protein